MRFPFGVAVSLLLLVVVDNGWLVSAMDTVARANSLHKLTRQEDALIRSYSVMTYMTLNPPMRKCLQSILAGDHNCPQDFRDATTLNGGLHKLSAFQFSQVEPTHLEKLNKWSPDGEPHLYRVMGADVHDLLPQWQPGQLYYDAAFVSTSLDSANVDRQRSSVKELVRAPYVFLRVEPLPEGSHGHYLNRNGLSVAKIEEEVLFEAGTMFCILSRRSDGEDTFMHVQELEGRLSVLEAAGREAVAATMEVAKKQCEELVAQAGKKTEAKKGDIVKTTKKGDEVTEEKETKKKKEKKERKKAEKKAKKEGKDLVPKEKKPGFFSRWFK